MFKMTINDIRCTIVRVEIGYVVAIGDHFWCYYGNCFNNFLLRFFLIIYVFFAHISFIYYSEKGNLENKLR